ncbi:MAG: hypothetical protein IPM29_27890 [Planctomycetes bacterium]|nr:hypothetical protein [Planctomycetota bacterium]
MSGARDRDEVAELLRRLEHRLRNLLGSIQVQVELARSLPGEATARDALASIERAATAADVELRELRERLRRAAQ